MKKFLLLFCAAVLAACGKTPTEEPSVDTPFRYDVSYVEDTDNFCNPERGLYVPNIFYFRNGRVPSPSTPAALRNIRRSGKTFSYSEFYIMEFVDKDLSEEALQSIRSTLEAHRTAGVKTIVRFAYSDGYAESDHPWDATLVQTLRHVEQLKPLFQEYADIIYVVQYGFVGSWGEGYYTDNYGMNPRTDEDYKPRRALMAALLDAVPVSRQVAVRYAGYKRGILGTTLADTITAATAFGPGDIARVAAFNDCFVSSSDDVGTYKSSADREMWAAETNYVSMGGETCDAPTAYCNCLSTYENLEKYHWTYLNEAYNKKTHNVWASEGCYDDIVKRLGYRFVLLGAAFDGDFRAGASWTLRLHFKNVGFASLINRRPLVWVLSNAADPSERYEIVSPKDPREWKGGHTYEYAETLSLPAGLKAGQTYRVSLWMPDEAETLHDDPEFAVRLANEGVWDEATGLNVLATFTAR
ncbi:MAG: DUF4832 domain-containing protein [Bacteroidales bacterium]|nr:DUF4832 domain-containing protein [Bacteroidales bacterium]